MDSNVKLYPHQQETLSKLKVGSILNGGVGSGKTLTSLAFYMQSYFDKDLIVLTTAKKRDTHDWEDEAKAIGIDHLVVDSWQNIGKYTHIYNAFFIFDEQRVSGSGKWAKAFITIAKANDWILLTATPGDNWMDYISVFIANGFYKNKTEFIDTHVEYDRFVKYPKVKTYHNNMLLLKHKQEVLVEMPVERKTVRHRRYIPVGYDKDLYNRITKDRWNPYLEKPIENASEYTQCLRHVVNTSSERIMALNFSICTTPKVIIFYNYNYELDILREICNEAEKTYSEWNGSKHEPISDSDEWAYLVQYTAGAEGWNCIETDSIIFYSLNYSYKVTEQAEGRIDRLNTTFVDLEYTYFISPSPVDRAIKRALKDKKTFNELRWGDYARKRLPS